MEAVATQAAVTAPQHMRALELANRVRLARAALKRDIRAGRTTVAEVVHRCPEEAAGMTVFDLLQSQPRWGVKRCRRLLAEMQMGERKAVGSLTERQRCALARLLGARELVLN